VVKDKILRDLVFPASLLFLFVEYIIPYILGSTGVVGILLKVGFWVANKFKIAFSGLEVEAISFETLSMDLYILLMDNSIVQRLDFVYARVHSITPEMIIIAHTSE
jgi:hypothetical protein